MPNQGYSDPRTYTVQVGPFAVSQVSVSGTSMVCSGNAYTYTADVPGGHKSGYTYSWTYPSGWTVQNTSTNTIRLYVPSNNSSYGTVRVSVNNGCGATVFTGRTVYPCNYMMSTGSFKVYPNPARNELNIENLADSDNYSGSAQREDAGSSESKAFRVEVFDHAEQMVKSGKSKDGKVLLDISGLRAGTYFLHIYDGKKVVREQILIQ
ncbi:T9SS type A sorting domain-containing protein [Algoriphagus terrigena]|uniref:T9SS type A sorting domain-containing protein n=1 Tax=Algoriphagus terrigena TaxID=344884 RepID=UPI00146F9D01|nr:T9SS type A sorting domain-containing protein [Algoriphagus terrigena]